MTTIAFFNNKGGVGKTSLVYHLAWMFAELGGRVVVADLDPQSNLTAMFLSEERLEELWAPADNRPTIYGAVQPLHEQTGDFAGPTLETPHDVDGNQPHLGHKSEDEPALESVTERIALIPGDLALSQFEDKLSQEWMNSSEGAIGPLRTISSFGRILAKAVETFHASIALVDVGPNLGAINRAALIAADQIIIPLGPDLFSLQGLRNLGPTLREWRVGWSDRRSKNKKPEVLLPHGDMLPSGYVLVRHSVRLDRPVKAFDRWMQKVPNAYRTEMLQEGNADPDLTPDTDPYCLGRLKDYRSLMAMAQENNKPMFKLRPADGAIGGHQAAVQDCYKDFKALAEKIAEQCSISLPGQ